MKDEQTGDLLIVESASSTEPPLSDNPYWRIIFPKPKDHPLSSWETRIWDIVQTEEEYPPSSDHYVHQSSYEMKEGDVRRHVQPIQSIIDVRYEYLGDGSDQQVSDLQQVLHLYARSPGRDDWQFPLQSAPHELRDILSLSGEVIFALADERSLIIQTCDPEPDETWTRGYQLVLVNFDSGINFPDFKYLALDNLSDKLLSFRGGIDVRGASRSKDMRQLQVKLLQLAEEASTSSTITSEAKASDAPKAEAPDAPKAESPVAHPWFTTDEDALYLGIKQGFQFYPPKPTAG